VDAEVGVEFFGRAAHVLAARHGTRDVSKGNTDVLRPLKFVGVGAWTRIIFGEIGPLTIVGGGFATPAQMIAESGEIVCI
jgi:hypothetical protein